MDKEISTALEALHVASDAIKGIDGVHSVSVDNDGSGGEIFFSVGNSEFKMPLVSE